MQARLIQTLLVALTFSTHLAFAKDSAALAEARRKVETTDYDAAEATLSQVRGAEQGEAQLLLARAWFERGKWDEAEKLLASSQGERARVTVLRARILHARGKSAEALKLVESQKNGLKTGTIAFRESELFRGELLLELGRRADADEPLRAVIAEYTEMPNTDADGLADVGKAAHLLRKPKDANQALGESETARKDRVDTLLMRAELFLEKYDPGHAEELARDVLKLAPKRADALVLMARIKLDQSLDFDAAEKFVKDALAINPKVRGAQAVLAGIALRDMELDAAEKAIDRGLAANPNDLELLSLRAGARFLSDDMTGFEAAKRAVLDRNKEFSSLYTIIAEFAEWEHRYDDIVAMMKEAVALDPEDGKAWGTLGLTQMRNGEEKDGLQSLERAWKKDRFNVMVYNTLNLYEKVIPTSYDSLNVGVFQFRIPKRELPVLERYVPQFAAEAFASMKARYNYVPSFPLHLELYETRENFSVRTSGLPNIGIQGVCFGKVVAAMSPKSEPFNWGNVLWHELGHVFAIQMSKNHVPRWFTEGLSEYETIARRPEWDRELDPQLYAALKSNALPSAVNMNRAFTHASDGLDVTVAYYASSQMLIYTVEKFGLAKVSAALRLWGEGKRTPEVIRLAFGVDASAYDQGFRSWALARLQRYNNQFMFADKPIPLETATKRAKDAPNDADAHATLAFSMLAEHQLDEAKRELDQALKLNAAHPKAHFLAAKLALGQKNPAESLTHLDAMRKAGADGYAVRDAMADAYQALKDKGRYRHSLEAAHRLDPTQTEPLEALFDLAVDEKRDADQLETLRALAPLDQHNRRAWRGLLMRLVAQKLWSEARNACESALYADVEDAEVHNLCAVALQAVGEKKRAVFEAESALLSEPKPKDAKEAHKLLAEFLQATNPKEAKLHREQAEKTP